MRPTSGSEGKVGDTPTPPIEDDPVPGHVAILDNKSDASSVCSQNSEPEGEYVDDYDETTVLFIFQIHLLHQI